MARTEAFRHSIRQNEGDAIIRIDYQAANREAFDVIDALARQFLADAAHPGQLRLPFTREEISGLTPEQTAFVKRMVDEFIQGLIPQLNGMATGTQAKETKRQRTPKARAAGGKP